MNDKDIKNIVRELAIYEMNYERSKYNNHNHDFSEIFNRKMDKLILHEKSYQARNSFIRILVSIIIVLTLTSLIIKPDIYANAARKIYELYDHFYKVQFQDDPSINGVKKYELDYIPDGWTLQEEYYYDDMGGSWYVRGNEIIDFSYGLSDSISQINCEGVHYEEFDMDDGTHIYYLQSDGEKPSTMQWLSSDNTTMFTLAAPLNKEEMIKIIQNIFIN